MRYLFLVFVSWGCNTTFFAQSATPYSLPTVVKLAVSNSTQVKKAQIDRHILDEKMLEQRSLAFPQIKTGANLDAFALLPTQFIPGDILGQPNGTYIPVQIGRPWQVTGFISAEQVLFSETGRRTIPAADITRALADLLITRNTEEITYQTATVYYQLLQTQQLQHTADANTEKLKALQRIADLQLANGYITPTDVKRLRVARTNLETQRQNLLTGIEALRQTLQFLCGIPFDQPFDIQEDMENPGADSLRWLTMLPQPEATVESQLLNRQISLNRTLRRAGQANNWPVVSAHTSGWLQGQLGTSELFKFNRRWFGMAMVGIKVQTNLFDGFRQKHQLAQIDLQHEQLGEDLRMLTGAKNLEFRQAKDQLRAALRGLQTQNENMALAREVNEKLALQYREGIVPLTDLLNTQTALSEAETNYFQQVFTYKLAVLKLAKSAGAISELTK